MQVLNRDLDVWQFGLEPVQGRLGDALPAVAVCCGVGCGQFLKNMWRHRTGFTITTTRGQVCTLWNYGLIEISGSLFFSMGDRQRGTLPKYFAVWTQKIWRTRTGLELEDLAPGKSASRELSLDGKPG